MQENEEYYWYWLCNISGIGNKKIRALLRAFHNAEEIYKASERLLTGSKAVSEADCLRIIDSRKNAVITRQYLKLQKKNIRFLHIESENYPIRLKNIYDAPYILYYKGRLPEESLPTVSVIGARDCTYYGREIAEQLGYKLAEYNVQIVSGMARGIDTYGHRGAVKAKGSTFAVLGCGVDICYPKENINLYMDLLEYGGVLSEYPPGTEPISGLFPQRNRIISGLSDVVVVVEARKKSGSLITADQALEQNKEVMAVPGRIGNPLSSGCNNLIKMGAQVVTCVEDILNNFENFQYSVLNETIDLFEKNKKELCEKNIILASCEKIVYSCIGLFPKNINQIIEETALSMNEVMNALLNLELNNHIKEISKNYYMRTVELE